MFSISLFVLLSEEIHNLKTQLCNVRQVCGLQSLIDTKFCFLIVAYFTYIYTSTVLIVQNCGTSTLFG